jgi:hypothetical protein
VASSSSDICLYATGSTKSAILELATVLGNRLKYTTLSDVIKDSVSNLIGDNLDQTLAQTYPGQYLNETHLMIHFLNVQTITSTNDSTVLPLSFSSSDIDRSERIKQSQQILRFSRTPLAAILHQINNQKPGFDFMNDQQINVFLKGIFMLVDNYFRVSNIREALEIFHQLMIAQSIFVLRHCSLHQQSSSAKPCLVVSTMFVKPPVNDPNSFLVYQLTALPAVVNKEKYMYSNIPSFIGINRDERTMITWRDATAMQDCLVSVIVSCAKVPLVTSLASIPCLGHLLSDRTKTHDSCEVVKSTDTQPAWLNQASLKLEMVCGTFPMCEVHTSAKYTQGQISSSIQSSLTLTL